MSRPATPRRRFATPVPLIAVTAVAFGLVASALTLRLRADLRDQILRREAEALASMVALQQGRAADELARFGLGSDPADWFPLLLETSRLRGVVALRLFDAAGELRDALPLPVSARLAPRDWGRLQQGESFARLREAMDADALRVGDPEPVETGGVPLLEVLAPLQTPGGTEFGGAAHYWIDGTAMAREFARLDRSLWLRGGVAAGVGAAIVLAALVWAFRRLRAAHRELQERSEDLARANREFSLAAKTSAVGAITAHLIHGLKNPLAGLEGYVSNQPGDLSPAGGAEWRAALETTQRIRTLVNEVVSILREEQTGGARYRVTTAELLGAAEEKLQPFARSRGVAFSCRADDEAELPGRRAHLVLLVLDNLLRNACEAVPPGGRVVLTATRVGGDAVFTVEDNGPGLAPAVRDQVFQPVTSTKTGGGGIGLVLSHQLAQHAGGLLTLEKSDARGCRFRLAVPVAAPAPVLSE
jgi:signal transduction histidine kinase